MYISTIYVGRSKLKETRLHKLIEYFVISLQILRKSNPKLEKEIVCIFDDKRLIEGPRIVIWRNLFLEGDLIKH